MCVDCFHKYTDKPVVNDKVLAAVALIKSHREPRKEPKWEFIPTKERVSGLLIYDVKSQPPDDKEPKDPDFGFLHIIVGDMNVDDDIFDLTTDHYMAEEYPNAEPWEREIFDALAKLTEAERATAIALDWGYTLDQLS